LHPDHSLSYLIIPIFKSLFSFLANCVMYSPQFRIVLERQWHIASHCRALDCAGWDYQLIGGFPIQRYSALGIPAKNVKSYSFPALWNYGLQKLKLPTSFCLNASAYLAQKALSYCKAGDIVISYSDTYQHFFKKIPSCVKVIERGSMHPEDYFAQIAKGFNEAGLPWQGPGPDAVRAELKATELAHFISVGSQHVKDGYTTRGFSSERILMIPYGVDTRRFSFQARTYPAKSPLRIAIVGVLGVRKGLLRFCKILQWLSERNISAQGVLVGPLEKEGALILQKFQNLDLEFTGVLKGDRLVEKMHSCQLYCLPSYEEGFPISLLEAMSTGLPAIISSDTGAAEAVSHSGNGIQLATFEAPEFEARLLPFLSNHQWLIQASHAAGETARQFFSLEAYSSRLHSEYQRMFSVIVEQGANLPMASVAFPVRCSN